MCAGYFHIYSLIIPFFRHVSNNSERLSNLLEATQRPGKTGIFSPPNLASFLYPLLPFNKVYFNAIGDCLVCTESRIHFSQASVSERAGLLLNSSFLLLRVHCSSDLWPCSSLCPRPGKPRDTSVAHLWQLSQPFVH